MSAKRRRLWRLLRSQRATFEGFSLQCHLDRPLSNDPDLYAHALRCQRNCLRKFFRSTALRSLRDLHSPAFRWRAFHELPLTARWPLPPDVSPRPGYYPKSLYSFGTFSRRCAGSYCVGLRLLDRLQLVEPLDQLASELPYRPHRQQGVLVSVAYLVALQPELSMKGRSYRELRRSPACVPVRVEKSPAWPNLT